MTEWLVNNRIRVSDAESLIQELRTKAQMILLGEKIHWGSDSKLMHEAADMIEAVLPKRA